MPLIEVPEHLLQRSRDHRRALGFAVDEDASTAAKPVAETPTTPVVPSGGGESKSPSNVLAPIPPAPPEEPPAPQSEWVTQAHERHKIPYWVMPVLLFLPIWLITYVGTLEEPTREEGVIYEGSVVYDEAGCAGCHGATGAGGTGPAFSNEAVVDTFRAVEDHIAWVVHGSQGFADAGRSTYGDKDKELLSYNGSAMSAFGDDLTAQELVAVVFYERIELGGHEDELPLAEAVWDMITHDEIEDFPDHFEEGPGGHFESQIAEWFAAARTSLSEGETASD